MEWEARNIEGDKWGVFLKQKFCKTDEPVCYGAATGPNAEKTTKRSAERLNKSEDVDKQANVDQ
jgi:hypothetical protein